MNLNSFGSLEARSIDGPDTIWPSDFHDTETNIMDDMSLSMSSLSINSSQSEYMIIDGPEFVRQKVSTFVRVPRPLTQQGQFRVHKRMEFRQKDSFRWGNTARVCVRVVRGPAAGVVFWIVCRLSAGSRSGGVKRNRVMYFPSVRHPLHRKQSHSFSEGRSSLFSTGSQAMFW